ncbi:MAG: formimidoylglutamate deiminase [Myxococcales bacterium]|nr:formimidoylglutamate deiminase [Myxococcales bacterium]
MDAKFSFASNGRLTTPAAPIHSEGNYFTIPGMVNAHSHSFQRVMRGLVEKKQRGQGDDDFWSWRALMYEIASNASAEDLELIGTWCFLDCLKTGFTHVGEFHYVHHKPDGSRYTPSYHLSKCLMNAARKVGIQLTVLHTAYHWNGPDDPAKGAQRRFIFNSVEEYLRHVLHALEQDDIEPHKQGLAIHSIRAVPETWLRPIAEFCATHQLPLHVHAAEQRKELEICQKVYGTSPIGLLLKHGVLGPNTTVVHGTHVDSADLEAMATSGATVCICPSTERNLGDGLAPIADYLKHQIPLAIGTDSHVRIDAVDELRSLEDHERLRLERRLVWLDHVPSLAEGLISVACQNGQRSLAPFQPAQNTDEVWIKIPVHLQEAPAEHTIQDWLLGGSGRDISRVKINGEWVLENGISTRLDEQGLGERVGKLLARYQTATAG